MKKIIAILMVVFLLIPTGIASADWQKITVTYNGDVIDFNVDPQIINGRTMVPFRGIFEAMGGTVGFDAQTRTVSSVIEDTTLSFVIGEYEATVKTADAEKKIPIDAAPVIVDNYTLVPVRFVAESAGLKVNWDEYYREVVIIDTDAWKEETTKKSEFLKMYFDMPTANAVLAYNENSQINAVLNFSVSNADAEEPFKSAGVENVNLSLNLKMVGSEYFDGKSTKANAAVTLDLSSLNSLMKRIGGKQLTDEEEDLINKTFKNHNINLEVIIDENLNTYIKVEGMQELVELLGIKEELFENNYIKFPSGIKASDIDASQAATLWGTFENTVKANDKLTSTDVKKFDYVFAMCADLFSDENVKTVKKENGEAQITFDITKEDFKKSIENLVASMWEYDENDLSEEEKAYVKEQKAEMIKELSVFEMAISGNMKIKDSTNSSSDMKISMKINSEENGSQMNIGFDIAIKENMQPSNSNVKIEVPQNAVELN